MDEQDPVARRLEIVARLLSLGYATWMLWTLVPEPRKRRMIMRAALAIQNCADWAASHTAAQAISLEATTGSEPSYALPYGFSRIREKAAAWYERARYS